MSGVELASLLVKVDATQPAQAARTLDALTASGRRAEVKIDQLADSSSRLATETQMAGASARLLGQALGAISLTAVILGFNQLKAATLAYTASVDEISTLVDTATVSMADLSAEAIKQAGVFNSVPTTQTKALYQIISAGASSAAQATETLTAANKLAVGGVTSVAVAADGLTSVLNAYGDKIASAADASDAMFIAVKGGKTTIAELAASLGAVSPLAAQVGVSFDELTAATAALTKGGISTEVATTGLRAILASVAKPSEEARDLSKALGLEFNSTALATKGLAGFLEDLNAKTGGNTDALAKLFGGVEALVPVLALSGQAGKDFTSILDDMAGKAGATDEAFKKIEAGAAFQVGRIFSTMAANAIGVGAAVAEDLTPALTAVANTVQGLERPTLALDIALKALAITTTALAAKALAGLGIQMAASVVGTIALTAAINGVTLTAAAAGIATHSLGLAVRFALGPVGLLVTAAGLLATAWSLYSRQAAVAAAETEALRSVTAAAKSTFDDYEAAGIAAANASGDVAEKARLAAEATRDAALAEVAYARATYERIAAQQTAAREEEVRVAREASSRISIGAMAGAGSGLPTAALAGTLPAAEAANAREKADERAAAAAIGYLAVQKRLADAERAIAEAIRGTGDAARAAASARAGAAAAALDADKDRKKGLTDEERALKRATEAAEDYAAGLQQDVAEFGRSSIQIKEMEIASAAAAAPTRELADAIRAAGDQVIGLMTGAAAIADLNSGIKTMAETIGDIDFEAGPLTEMADELRLIDNLALDAGRGMEDAFGKAGRAIGGLVGALTGYRSQLAEIRKAVNDNTLTAIQGAREEQSVRVRSYGDMAGSAKDFFHEGSKGYELMAGAEKAFRIIEFGLALQAIAMHGAEAAAAVGGETIKTGATVAGSAIRTPLKAAEGIAGIFAALGPFGFPVAVAATAVMVAAGVKAFGGGGGGATPGATDMADRQASQGTGSVLGSADAKSESIVKSLDLIEAHTNRDLEFSNGMLKSLRSIDNQIGAVAAALARSFGAGGSLTTDGLDLGKTNDAPGLGTAFLSSGTSLLLPGLFGSKTNRTLQDQGIDLQGGSLESILSGGLSGNTFQQVLSETKKKFLGVTYSDKTKSTTTTGDLDGDFLRQSTLLLGSLRDGVLAAATTLGVEGADATLNALQIELGKFSFKDMDAGQIQAELEAVFGKAVDGMAGAVVPGLTVFQKAGEGLFETLTRVARQYQVVDVSLSSIGMTFGAVGVASLAAREHLVDLFGGLDAFTEQTQFFGETFLTEAERLAPIQAAVTKEMARLGLATVDTRDEFKALVLGLDVSTQAGSELYAALMAVAPAFAKVTEESQAVADARDVLSAAYERESGALQNTIDKFEGFADSLKKFRDQLYSGPAAMLSPEEQYRASKSLFEQTSAAARGGDEKAIGDLQSVSQAYLDASKDYYASSASYFQDLEAVRSAVTATQGYAQSQVSAAERELAALDKQVEGQIETNKILVSVRDAILGLNAAKAAAGGGAGQASGGFDGSDYLAANADVAAAFQKYLAGDPAFMAQSGYAPGMSADQFGTTHYDRGGKDENRPTFVMAPAPASTMAAAVSNDNAKVEAKLDAVIREMQALVRQGGAASPAMIAELQQLREEVASNSRALAAAAAN